MAHDFNNLLTVIQGCAGLLLVAWGPPMSMRKDVEEVIGDRQRTGPPANPSIAGIQPSAVLRRKSSISMPSWPLDGMLRRLIGLISSLRLLDFGCRRIAWTGRAGLAAVLVDLVVNADAMPRHLEQCD